MPGDSGTKFRRPYHQNVQNSVLSFSLYSYFHILVIGALLEYQPFSLFLRPHLVQYGDTAFIASMSSFVASRIQSDWLPSYLPCGPLNGRSICFGNLLVQSVVNTVCMILCLVPPDHCTIPQFLVVQINGISQTCILRTSRAKTNHFKHSQVRQTWVNSSFRYPYPPGPSSRVTGLSHQAFFSFFANFYKCKVLIDFLGLKSLQVFKNNKFGFKITSF